MPARSCFTSIRAMPRGARAWILTIPHALWMRSGPACPEFPWACRPAGGLPRKDARGSSRSGHGRCLPDYVSVNLIEDDAGEVIDLVLDKGIGVEAGLWSAADAEKFVAIPNARYCLRVLIEINEREFAAGAEATRQIIEVLDRADIRLPRMLHGYENTMWPFYREALRLQLDARIGLEDGKFLPSGTEAKDNADLIRAAHALRS
jgi:uncharacterized protein (DUF849 family)